MATPRDVGRLVSLQVARDVGRLRPSLAQAKPVEVTERYCGIALGTLRPGGSPLLASWEDVVLAIMAPRAMKTTALAVPAVRVEGLPARGAPPDHGRGTSASRARHEQAPTRSDVSVTFGGRWRSPRRATWRTRAGSRPAGTATGTVGPSGQALSAAPLLVSLRTLPSFG